MKETGIVASGTPRSRSDTSAVNDRVIFFVTKPIGDAVVAVVLVSSIACEMPRVLCALIGSKRLQRLSEVSIRKIENSTIIITWKETHVPQM